ncbi:hypothetical protein EWM17_19725, partial [Clostridioides difficile]
VGIFFIKFVNIVPSGNVVNSSMGPAIILVFYAFTGFESFIVADSGQNEPKAVANPTARVDHDIILITQDIVPTSNPIKSPKA